MKTVACGRGFHNRVAGGSNLMSGICEEENQSGNQMHKASVLVDVKILHLNALD